MIEQFIPPAAWPPFEQLRQALWNIESGLSNTIAAMQMVVERRTSGDEIEYLSGNPPDSRLWIMFREPPAPYDDIENRLRRSIELLRDQYIPLVIYSTPIASDALTELSLRTLTDLEAISGEARWGPCTRLWINRIAQRYPYSAERRSQCKSEGFPEDVAAALDVSKNCPHLIDRWREQEQQIRSRLEQLEVCRSMNPQ
jgi:hypothetical protein